ncbi:MAG: Pr6Pr family membrane protein [Bifidobacteriaceae bacterium]|jgi:hypothetical protein|nr:Pr6Pr family membrane protein [Bifidobacteriaceae bacterium]
MAVSNRIGALIYRLVAVCLIAAGLVRLVGLFDGGFSGGAFVFYTTQSNVLSLIWMATMAAMTAWAIVRDGPRGSCAPAPRLGATAMMAITVTMIVYLVVLAPAAFQQDSDYRPFTLTDDLIHIITPCLVIADWFAFSPKGRLRLFDPVLWAGPPYAYLAFVFIWAATGHDFGEGRSYPYSFVDVDAHGVGGVAVQIGVLSVALIGFGYGYLAADRALARAARRRAAQVAQAAEVAGVQPEPEGR